MKKTYEKCRKRTNNIMNKPKLQKLVEYTYEIVYFHKFKRTV